MVLIGGTSHVGKSTVARLVADRLGFEYVSTDKLGRHPGRPWGTPGRDVPRHVAEHYRSLNGEQLVDALLEHYEQMWPRIEELVTRHATTAAPGLVLEGSGVWPANVVRLTTPYTSAVWLTADAQTLTTRIHTASRYTHLPAENRHLIDQFLTRSLGYQTRLLPLVRHRLDASTHSPEALADHVLGLPPPIRAGDWR